MGAFGPAGAQGLFDPMPGYTAGAGLLDEEGAGRGFFWAGYYRFGFGLTDGDAMVAFQVPGAASKYRLGNESDLYFEFALGYRHPLDGGSAFIAEAMVNGFGDSNALVRDDPLEEGGDLVQAYAGVEGLGAGVAREAFVWAGRRYYRRRDVHMTDFYYENYTGDGVGLENLRLGAVGLSTALFHDDAEDDDFRSTALDLRVHDIPLGGDWRGELGLALLDDGGDDASGDGGFALRLHAENFSLPWGTWQNALLYGEGTGLDFSSTGVVGAGDGDSRLRLVTHTLLTPSERFQTQATAVWQRTEIGDLSEDWASLGIRPQVNFTDEWGLAVELGYDRVDPEDGDARSLRKVTLAPFYSFGRTGYFARPQLRAYVTHADWNEPGAITSQASLGGQTDGTSIGIQIENWW
jgi:maltoporin